MTHEASENESNEKWLRGLSGVMFRFQDSERILAIADELAELCKLVDEAVRKDTEGSIWSVGLLREWFNEWIERARRLRDPARGEKL